jgi:hypothetical protein
MNQLHFELSIDGCAGPAIMGIYVWGTRNSAWGTRKQGATHLWPLMALTGGLNLLNASIVIGVSAIPTDLQRQIRMKAPCKASAQHLDPPAGSKRRTIINTHHTCRSEAAVHRTYRTYVFSHEKEIELV